MSFSAARLAGLLCLPGLVLAQAPRSAPFTVEDLGRLVGLSDAQIAPDGRTIAVKVTRTDMKANKTATELVLVDAATGAQKVLVRDRKGLAHARWSPDGRTLAFLADRDGKEQIFLLPMDGGEARRLTDAPTGVQQFAWSPDGGRLAFAAEDEAPKLAEDRKGEDAFDIENDSIFASEPTVPVHLWITDLEGKATRKTSGTWSLANTPPPSPPASPLAWSPDGKTIAFAKQASPHTGDQEKTSVQLLDVASGAIRPLTGEARFEGFPAFSPDGRQIAYWFPRDGDYVNQNEIHLVDAGAARAATSPAPWTAASTASSGPRTERPWWWGATTARGWASGCSPWKARPAAWTWRTWIPAGPSGSTSARRRPAPWPSPAAPPPIPPSFM
ncbi:MAG: PD40 domain-containing protein [Holophagaceae bacterium]|nr:PD40 domain-containing protein [Holophagaceae bacterium]